MSAPKQPSWAKPTSSSKMNTTLGAPGRARGGTGQAGTDSPAVRPTTPLNGLPSGHSLTVATSPSKHDQSASQRARRQVLERLVRLVDAVALGDQLVDLQLAAQVQV